MTDSIQDRRTVFTGDTAAGKFLDKWDREVPPERRTYGVKVCLAGAEGKGFRDGLYRVGVRHILVSYYYLRKWLSKHSVEEISTDLGRFDYVILDSGGFTLLKEAKLNPEMAVDVRGYAEEYYSEVKRIGHLFSMCAEVDLPDKIGIDYSEGIKKELLSGGIQIVPVMQGQPIEYFDRLEWFETYPYIAVGSACIGPPKFKGWLRDVFLKGQACGNLFHGFGATTDEVLAKHQFFSVDSSVGAGSYVWVEKGGAVSRVRIGDLYQEVGESHRVGHEGRAEAEGYRTLTLAYEDGVAIQKWSRLKSVVRHDVKKPRVLIKVQGGRSIEATSDHSLFKMDKTGRLFEVKPSDLRVGDWIVCQGKGSWIGRGLDRLVIDVDLPREARGRKWPSRTASVEFGLDVSLLELMGFWIGDGSYTGETSMSFSCGEHREPVIRVEKFAGSIERKATVSSKNDVSVSHHRIVRAWRKLGFGEGAARKKLPGWFWSLSEGQACSVLRGLFTADGSGGEKPYLATNSEELAHQVQDALLQLGIFSGKSLAGENHRVTISDSASKERFKSKVGFFVEEKQESVLVKDVRGGRHSEIPAELCYGPRYSDGKPVYSNRVSRDIAAHFCDTDILSSEVVFLPIVGMEELSLEMSDVYDLEVPDTQRFIANGIVAHNTTWLDGGKFGTTMIYENGRLRYYDMEHKAVRNKYKRMFEENGLVFNDIKDDKALEVNMMNAVAWRQLGEGLKYDTRNSYWLTEEEKNAAADIRTAIYNENGLIDRSKSIVRAEVRRHEIQKDARRDDRVHEPLHCDLCLMVGKCPRYKKGSTCGFDINLQIETEQDLHNAMKVLFEAAFGRVMNGMLFEKLHGGSLDKNVSSELRNVVGIIKDLREIYSPKTARGNGDEGESFTLSGKASSGGVLSQMLSKVFGAEEDIGAEGETINVTPVRETQE
jgi:intein/homing endonuclease